MIYISVCIMNMVLILPICKPGGTVHKDEHGTLAQFCNLKNICVKTFKPNNIVFFLFQRF